MKKYLVLIGAAILVVALASPSMAQFKSWGHLEIQTIWTTNGDFDNNGARNNPLNRVILPAWMSQTGSGLDSAGRQDDSDTTQKQIAERFRFYLQYGDPKTVRAVLGFEADSTNWGEAANTSPAGGGRMGVYRADQVQLEIKWAFLEFVVPNTPLTVTAGIQPFAFGGRLFMNNDAPGVQASVNFAPHKFTAFWWRENDVNTNTYEVNDTYGLEYRLAQKQFNVSAFFAYKNDVRDALIDDRNPNVRFSDNPWWAGIAAGFRPGNFDVSGQFIYNGGEREAKVTPGVAVLPGDRDYSAWAAEALLKYRIGPGMFVGLEGFYSTGNDADDGDITEYTTPTGSESMSIFGNDRTVFFWMNAAQIGYYHHRNLPFSGMWYVSPSFEYSPTPWLRFKLNYLYIADTAEGTPGALPGTTFAKRVNSPIGAQQIKDEDFVGHEINLITSINIYKAFVWNIGVAYFMPGDVYDVPATATTPGKDADEAFALNTKLIYAF